ncbi:MAG: ATP-dependent helicase [Exiguobacterium chiriqhucha]|uniref:UvrD-helicase domain-containing protein n=1 Tax=Exiguobacterium chiriqhucha TaxID=1385984 RepID=UPI00144E0C2F|nr:UvrD-helicase domain-containing protein [Exiguobacterium chiriqhucha]KAB2863791.1 MAG: ATP-dependent helicase [Exiguobacterium chiriqhucha]
MQILNDQKQFSEDEIQLTDQQQSIVDSQGDELLIRGIAGSGKTLVLLKKAKKIAKKHPEKKVMIFTYAKSLTNASRILTERHNMENINVSTFHSWAMKIYRQIFISRLEILQGSNQQNLVKKAINITRVDHRFVKEEKYLDFLQSEISWIKGKGIRTIQDYLEASRKGRGSSTRVTLKDREIVYQVFRNYESEKKGKLDFDDFAYKLMEVKDRITDNQKIDYILIDEAQDLQQIQLQLLKHCSKKAIIIAADKGQKIYNTSFTWKEVGLNIMGGRTKVLRDSHRSTKQIIELATSLQKKDKVLLDEEYVAPTLPEREGELPKLWVFEDKESQDKAIISQINQIVKVRPDATIGILYRNSLGGDSALSRIGSKLKRLGIKTMNIRANEDVNPYSPGVKFSTFHSAKGLEFDFVLIADLLEPTRLPSEDELEDFWEVERRLLYVAITRAKEHLQLFSYGEINRLVHELDSNFYSSEK